MGIGLYDVMEFAEKLALAIAWSRKSQDVLARETGISQSAISDMTNGKRRPYFDQAVQLATATGVSLTWLADPYGDVRGLDSVRPAEGLSVDDGLVLDTFHRLKIDVYEAIRRLKRPDAAVGIPAMGPPLGKSSTDEATRQAELERERKRAANGGMPKRPKPKSGG